MNKYHNNCAYSEMGRRSKEVKIAKTTIHIEDRTAQDMISFKKHGEQWSEFINRIYREWKTIPEYKVRLQDLSDENRFANETYQAQTKMIQKLRGELEIKQSL